ncbi:MAG TPA: cell division protein FtsL [Clostridia bacterium]|nr:cell division protein FtsL [Clostridia bacterium]
MIEKNYGYVDGSAARKLGYDVYEENKVLREKKRYKNNRKIKLKSVFAIVAILAAALVVMCRYAIITEVSYEISQKQALYENLRNDNSLLKVQIETETNLADIKEIAETKLGMQTPDKSQRVYIKVPRKDYTVMLDPKNETDGNDSVLKTFINKLAGLVSILE